MRYETVRVLILSPSWHRGGTAFRVEPYNSMFVIPCCFITPCFKGLTWQWRYISMSERRQYVGGSERGCPRGRSARNKEVHIIMRPEQLSGTESYRSKSASSLHKKMRRRCRLIAADMWFVRVPQRYSDYRILKMLIFSIKKVSK